jgi:hypothetical protein
MNSTKKRLILVLGIIGALLYGGWSIYQGQVAEDQKRNFFAAPAASASGAPDAFHNAAPPPQP